MILEPGNPWGRIRGKLSTTPEQALKMFGFPQAPDALGVIFREYTFFNDNLNKLRATYISNYRPPSNPRTHKQQVNRKKMLKAVKNWHTIAEQERQNWNRRAEGRHMSGFNLHNSYHLRGLEWTT